MGGLLRRRASPSKERLAISCSGVTSRDCRRAANSGVKTSLASFVVSVVIGSVGSVGLLVVARILASVVIAEKAPTYETGAEKTGEETAAARARRATLDARIVGSQ